MNILLVDDDVNVLESLQFGVAYSLLGIEKIYVAENAADAKKILKNVPILAPLVPSSSCEENITVTLQGRFLSRSRHNKIEAIPALSSRQEADN